MAPAKKPQKAQGVATATKAEKDADVVMGVCAFISDSNF